jgi:3-deoxy-D-manno-octulosonic-acid transferase
VAALVALAGAPVGLGVLALRPSWRPGLRERLGAAPHARPGALWVHAASVGEILAALSLLDHARAAGHGVFASTMTLTGRDVLRRARPGLPSSLAPLDHPWCVAAALDRVRPRALVLVETELWPSWIAAAAERRIPVVVVSGRLSERSLPRYRRLRPLLASTLARIAAVGARGEEDAARFAQLGIPEPRIRVTGDLKLEPPLGRPALAPDLARVLADLPLFVAGSTHAGEESAALEALAAADAAGIAARLVLAPRRPARAGDAAAQIERAGRRVRRRSALGTEPLATGEVLLLDGLGDLAAVYTRARVAFVGGTLVDVGGHNLLEPIHAGAPVLFGPSTSNAREAAELLLACGAGRRVRDLQELVRAVVEALGDPAAARARAAAGRHALDEHRGSAARSLALVQAELARADAMRA